MRQMNRRFVVTGAVLIALAIGFFVYMMGMAPRSNDPKALMETVGQVSGVAGAIGVVLIVLGLRGKTPAG
jgi:predicted permease